MLYNIHYITVSKRNNSFYLHHFIAHLSSTGSGRIGSDKNRWGIWNSCSIPFTIREHRRIAHTGFALLARGLLTMIDLSGGCARQTCMLPETHRYFDTRYIFSGWRNGWFLSESAAALASRDLPEMTDGGISFPLGTFIRCELSQSVRSCNARISGRETSARSSDSRAYKFPDNQTIMPLG